MSVESRLDRLERDDGGRCEVCGVDPNSDAIGMVRSSGDPDPEPCAFCDRTPNVLTIEEVIVERADDDTLAKVITGDPAATADQLTDDELSDLSQE